MPLTVTVPSVPSLVPMNTFDPLVSVPPLVTFRTPLPKFAIVRVPLRSTTAFGPLIVIVPMEPSASPRVSAVPLIRPLSLTVRVPVPEEPTRNCVGLPAVPICPPDVTVKNAVLSAALAMMIWSPELFVAKTPFLNVKRPVAPPRVPMMAELPLVSV